MVNKKFNKLSERQRNILRFMQKYVGQTGYPPTIREIGEATGINSTSVVNYNLNKLVEAGYLERSDRVSRGLRLIAEIPGGKSRRVSAAGSGAYVPLMGQIVASKPVMIPDEPRIEEQLEVPPYLLGGYDPEEVFALQIKGESMIDAMIAEGDIVLMRRQETAERGDMVAVWLKNEGQTTLKYYYPEGEKIRLQPAHPTMDPIMVDAMNCAIQGKVLSVIRQMR